MQLEDIKTVAKTASACIKRYEAESQTLKKKIAELSEENSNLKKKIASREMAEEMELDPDTKRSVDEKCATLLTKDLRVVREAMELDLTKKTATLGELGPDNDNGYTDPIKASIKALI